MTDIRCKLPIGAGRAAGGGGPGSDTTAIHDNVSAEISAIALKSAPANGDLIVIEDSADGNAKKRITVASLPGGTTIGSNRTAYVEKHGNDGTGAIGDLSKPYLTINAANVACAALVSPPAADNPALVKIGTGKFAEYVICKDWVLIEGDHHNSTIISGVSDVGPLLDSTSANGCGNHSKMSNLLLWFTPSANGQIGVLSDTVTADYNRCPMDIFDSNNYYFTAWEHRQGTISCLESSVSTEGLTGTGTPSGDIVIRNALNDTVYLEVTTFFLFVTAQVGGNITLFRDNSTGKTSVANADATVIVPASYAGVVKGFENLEQVGFGKLVTGSKFTCIGAGSGTYYAIYSDSGGVSIVNTDSLEVASFGMGAAYAAYANGVDDTIDLIFSSIQSGLLTGGAGTVNKIVSQGNDLRVNTAIVDENFLLNTPTNETLQEILSFSFSAGWESGADIVDNVDGTADVTAGTGLIRITNDEDAQLKSFDHALVSALALTDLSWNYVYVDYNAGSPVVTVTTNEASVRENGNDKYELYAVHRSGTILTIVDSKRIVKNTLGRMQEERVEVEDIKRTIGLIIGETGTRNISVSTGEYWVHLCRNIFSTFDTSGSDTFDAYYNNGAIKISAQTQWDNAQYDNGGVLTNYINGRYGYLDYYMLGNGKIIEVYGTAQYTLLSEAEIGPIGGLPLVAQKHGLYLGRFVFQEGSATTSTVFSAFITAIAGAGSVTDHGNLSGLADDDHSQYALLLGRSGGQTLYGSPDASETLTLAGSSNATPGALLLNPTGGWIGTGRTPTFGVDFHNPLDEDNELHVSTSGLSNKEASITVEGDSGSTATLSSSGSSFDLTFDGNTFSIVSGASTKLTVWSGGVNLFKDFIFNRGNSSGDGAVQGNVNDNIQYWDFDTELVCFGSDDPVCRVDVRADQGDFAGQFGTGSEGVTLSTDDTGAIGQVLGFAGAEGVGAWNDLLVRAGNAQLYFDESTGGIGLTSTPRGLFDLNPTLIGVDSYVYPYPEVTTTERGNLTGMVAGAHVYDTDVDGVYFYNGSTWVQAY